jgi:hypothetical protein
VFYEVRVGFEVLMAPERRDRRSDPMGSSDSGMSSMVWFSRLSEVLGCWGQRQQLHKVQGALGQRIDRGNKGGTRGRG